MASIAVASEFPEIKAFTFLSQIAHIVIALGRHCQCSCQIVAKCDMLRRSNQSP
jgi:hypothetical protein